MLPYLRIWPSKRKNRGEIRQKSLLIFFPPRCYCSLFFARYGDPDPTSRVVMRFETLSNRFELYTRGENIELLRT